MDYACMFEVSFHKQEVANILLKEGYKPSFDHVMHTGRVYPAMLFTQFLFIYTQSCIWVIPNIIHNLIYMLEYIEEIR